ncbi:MAG TPA: hypothetical protein VGC87_01515 [Pyrinomonadaceae bacterium]|jgi:hypothetical protein
MTDPTVATFSFLSWVRQGLAARRDTGLTVKDGHLSLPVRLRLNNANLADVPVQLYGPGDIVGIDPREIVRFEPQHLMADFEPNYLPFVEFDHPDFPWMFTPAVADAAGRLPPWLCLVAVRKTSAQLTADTRRPLPVLECLLQELPNLAESWAWAHAQVTRSAAVPNVPDALAQQERTVSRLLCPRRLEPATAYYACLVPTYAVGRMAGLGESFTIEDERALRAAWTTAPVGSAQTTLRLPVYHHWEFSTGMAGDFEALARRLQPRPLRAEVGVKEMDVSRPGWGVGPFPAKAAGAVVKLEGALRNPNVPTAPWPDDVRVPFQTKLRQILDTSAKPVSATSAPAVGPPLYGQWYPKLESLPAAGAPPYWLSEVNLDPRYRVAAGLGALVVRYRQEELMAEAWDQLAAQEADHEQRKRAQLAEEVGLTLADKHLAPLSPQSLMQVTAPLRAAVPQPAAAATAATARVAAAPPAPESSLNSLRGGAASAAFRRIARARGPIARRLAAVEGKGGAVSAGAAGSPNSAAISAALFGPTGESAAPMVNLMAGFTAMGSRAAGQPVKTLSVAPAAQADAPLSEAPAEQSTDLARFAPTFTSPMYEPLRDYFADVLLPGLEHVPANSVSLLMTNPKFVEAYMLGLNHEMSRELLWRDYPADRRGTYFRQFWDVSGHTSQERSQLADITPVADWRDDTHLGEHSGGSASAAQIVLVIRGDLINRYPRSLIYALEAQWSGSAARVPGTSELYPMFRVTRAPDITMLGFALTQQQARGADAPAAGSPGGAGWFFVLQEQPTEPRFGLDVATDQTFGTKPTKWSDLSWAHLAANADSLRQIVYVPLNGTPKSPPPALKNPPPGSATWGKNSAHMASILRQSPFRLVIHARTWLSA